MRVRSLVALFGLFAVTAVQAGMIAGVDPKSASLTVLDGSEPYFSISYFAWGPEWSGVKRKASRQNETFMRRRHQPQFLRRLVFQIERFQGGHLVAGKQHDVYASAQGAAISGGVEAAAASVMERERQHPLKSPYVSAHAHGPRAQIEAAGAARQRRILHRQQLDAGACVRQGGETIDRRHACNACVRIA